MQSFQWEELTAELNPPCLVIVNFFMILPHVPLESGTSHLVKMPLLNLVLLSFFYDWVLQYDLCNVPRTNRPAAIVISVLTGAACIR